MHSPTEVPAINLHGLASLNSNITPTLYGPLKTSTPARAILFFNAFLIMIMSWLGSPLCGRSGIDPLVVRAFYDQRRSLVARNLDDIDFVACSGATASAVDGRGEVFSAHIC